MQLKNFRVIWVTDCPFARFLRAPIHRFGRVAKSHPRSALNGPYVSFATSTRSTSGVSTDRNDEILVSYLSPASEKRRHFAVQGFNEKLRESERSYFADGIGPIMDFILWLTLHLEMDREITRVALAARGSLLETFPFCRLRHLLTRSLETRWCSVSDTDFDKWCCQL